jgi:hypothetical protein
MVKLIDSPNHHQYNFAQYIFALKAFLLLRDRPEYNHLNVPILAKKYVALSAKERLGYMMEGIQLRFEVEYFHRILWFREEMGHLKEYLDKGFNYQP